MDTPRENKVNSIQQVFTDEIKELKKKYIPIRNILKSEHIFLAFHKGCLDGARKAKDITKDICDRTRRELVAVKVCKTMEESEFESIKREHDLLFALEPLDKDKQFWKYKDIGRECGDNTDVCAWIAFHFVYPSITLGIFKTHWLQEVQQPIPIEFVAHVFFKLCSALRFLHNDCRIAINTLNEATIILDANGLEEKPRLPKLLLIDLSRGMEYKEENGSKEHRYDIARMRNETYDMINACGKDLESREKFVHPEKGSQFHGFERSLQDDKVDEIEIFSGMWGLAALRCSRMESSATERISAEVVKLAESKEFLVLDDDIRNAMRGRYG